MSSEGGGGLGSGEFYGRDSGDFGGQGGGSGGGGGLGPGLGAGMGMLGGLLGAMGGGPGGRMGPMQSMGPRGHFGLWPSCGCGSILIIAAIILFICGGCLQMMGQ
jgi:hypothetical protein